MSLMVVVMSDVLLNPDAQGFVAGTPAGLPPLRQRMRGPTGTP
jgi:hypothetical protein